MGTYVPLKDALAVGLREDNATQLFPCICLCLRWCIFIHIDAGRAYGKYNCAYLFARIHAYLWVCINLDFVMQLR